MATDDAKQALTRKERERLAHRRAILEAAERVFARNGYHGATVEQIAQEAEFAVGTLYNYFPKGKDQLYEEVVVGLVDEFMAEFRRRVAACDDPAEAIGEVIAVRLRMFEKHRDFARVLMESVFGGHGDPSLALPQRSMSAFEEGVATMREVFERGIRQGVFAEADPLYLTLALHGVLNAFIAYWGRGEPSEPVEERIAKLREMFLSWVGRRAR